MHHSVLPLFIACTITEFPVTSSLALNNWGQKYCQTLGKKPNPCKGQWPEALWCEDNYFPKGNFQLFNSLFHSCTLFLQSVCFLLLICLCVICGTYVSRINAVSWHIARWTFASPGLFTWFVYVRTYCVRTITLFGRRPNKKRDVLAKLLLC